MTYLNASHVPSSNGLPNLFGVLRRSIGDHLRRSRVYHDTRAQLEAMSDRDLADIGITRFMIEGIAAESGARA